MTRVTSFECLTELLDEFFHISSAITVTYVNSTLQIYTFISTKALYNVIQCISSSAAGFAGISYYICYIPAIHVSKASPYGMKSHYSYPMYKVNVISIDWIVDFVISALFISLR